MTSCPCDWDHDGFLTIADHFRFINDWLAGRGDYNGDGATDRQDIADFTSCFNSPPDGCVRIPRRR